MYEHLLPFPTTSFQLIHTEETETTYSFYLQSTAHSAPCPNCHSVSSHRHSRTTRTIQDLPINEKEVHYFLQLQKWFCQKPTCSVRIFTERLAQADSYQRRTTRCTTALRNMAFATNCVEAAKLSESLHIPVSHDTLLRIIYQTEQPQETSPFPGFG